jgi:hypothetical protein
MAADELVFDPVYPLPPKPAPPPPAEKQKREKKKKLKTQLPDYWPLAELPQPQPWPAPPMEFKLPDQWPVAPLASPPAPTAPGPAPSLQPETFEVLAYRSGTEAWPLAPQPAQPTKVIFSPPEPTPAEPHFSSARRERRRFTWESPEMYWEEAD